MPLSNEQIAMRRGGIGASEVAAILGLDRYRTPFEVWMEKTGRIEPFKGNVATDMGHRLEPIVSDLYAEKNHVLMRTVETIQGDEPWMFSTPDRVAVDLERNREWLVEIKTKSRYNMVEFGEEGTDQVPHAILCQVAWQQIVTGMTQPVDVAVLVDGRDFLTYTVSYDKELATMLVTTLRDWWRRHIVNGIEPEVDGASAIDYLKAKFATHGKDVVQADDSAERYLEDLRSARAMEKDAEAMADVAKAHLMEAIGGNAGMKGLAGSVSWREAKGRTSVDWQAVAEQLAQETGASMDMLASITGRCTRMGAAQRVFRFTPSKSVGPVLITGAEPLALTSGDDQ